MHKKRKYLFQLNHPAHFHLFKHVIDTLTSQGHIIQICIKEKDILKDLVSNYNYKQISHNYRRKNIFSIIKSIINRDYSLFKIVKSFKPDLMIGTSPEIGHISFLTGYKSIFFGEDDVNLSLFMYVGALTCYPFFNTIISPDGVNNSIWNKKTVFYPGFQKLSYLHPKKFIPNRSVVNIEKKIKYFIIRLSSLQAYHDNSKGGISNKLLDKIINILKNKGKILISSERELPDKYREFIFKGRKDDIHHYLYYASLFIGDSQSMALESAILGTPNIRFSDFVGKISVLNEIEKKYNLSNGIHSDNPDFLLDKIIDLVDNEETILYYKAKKDELIKNKIDVSDFYVWFIENYPNSVSTMISNPEYVKRFK